MAPPPLIEIVGSLNIDLVTTTPRVPSGGETVTASSFSTGFGGKGANQAVACARLLRDERHAPPRGGVRVRMLGAVGDDKFGPDFKRHLEEEGLEVDGVQVVEGVSTGTAVILVEEKSGENRILVTPGANERVRPGRLKLEEGEGAVLFQLETPLDTVVQCIAEAKRMGKQVVLNPAPAIELPKEVYEGLDSLVMNEHEAALLSGISEERLTSSLDEAAEYFIQRGVVNVVITLGAEGVYKRNGHDEKGLQVPAHKVSVVDTTAAGDTFVGAYIVQRILASNESNAGQDVKGASNFSDDIDFANRASAKTVQKEGAQSSIPFRNDV